MAIRRRGYRAGLFLVLGVAVGVLLSVASSAPALKPMRAAVPPTTLPQARQPKPAKEPASPSPRPDGVTRSPQQKEPASPSPRIDSMKQAPPPRTSITITPTARTTASTFWQFSKEAAPDSVGKAVTPMAPSSEANQEVGFVYVGAYGIAAHVRKQRSPPPRRIVLAPTFPKVGSSWVFGVLEQLTGVVSAAVYNEAPSHNYTNVGTAGRGGTVYTFQRLRHSNTGVLQPHDSVIVKTHFPHLALRDERDVEATRLLRHPMLTVMSALSHYQRLEDKVPLAKLPVVAVSFSAFMDKWNQSATALYAAGVPVMTVRVEDLCTDATGALWSQLLEFAGRSLRSGLTAVGDTECNLNRIMGGDRWETVPPGVRSDVAGKVGKWVAQFGYTPL